MTIYNAGFTTTGNLSTPVPEWNLYDQTLSTAVALLDEVDNDTGATIAMSSTGTPGSTASSVFGDSDLFGFPEAIWDAVVFTPNGGSNTFTLAGLPANAAYTVDWIAHANNASRDTDVTVGGTTKTALNAADSASREAPTQFTGTTTGSGTLVLSYEAAAVNGQFFGYCNGFIIDVADGAGPVITDVNTTNIVQVDDTPTVTGTAFLATAGSQTWNAESVGVDTWSDTQIVCEAITRGDKAYDTNYDWVVTDNLAVDSAAFSVQLAIETGFQFVVLSSPINALVGGFRTSLCVGSSPACVTGDQLRVPTTTDQGKALDISAADGTFVITAAGNTLQTFDFEIWDANGDTGDKWSLSTAAVINGVIVSGGIVTPIVSNIVRSIVH